MIIIFKNEILSFHIFVGLSRNPKMAQYSHLNHTYCCNKKTRTNLINDKKHLIEKKKKGMQMDQLSRTIVIQHVLLTELLLVCLISAKVFYLRMELTGFCPNSFKTLTL